MTQEPFLQQLKQICQCKGNSSSGVDGCGGALTGTINSSFLYFGSQWLEK